MKRELLSLVMVAGAAASLCAAAVHAVPALKAGLWEMHFHSSVGGGDAALPPTVCVGAMSAQDRQTEQDNIKTSCGKYESREVDGKWVVDAVCSARGRTLTKHSETSLDGDRYHEVNTAPQGTTTSDGKWLGPCKPGQKPDTFK